MHVFVAMTRSECGMCCLRMSQPDVCSSNMHVTPLPCYRMQALTIIGLGTAYTNIRLMLFAIWPFGQAIRDQVSQGPDHGQMQRKLCKSHADLC